MLTADLVDARRKDGELLLRPLDAKAREEALAIAAAHLEAARAHVGKTRGELDEAWDDANANASRPKVAAGLRKLAADACDFEPSDSLDPAEVRRTLFLRASEIRRTRDGGEPFDRAAVVAEVAGSLGTTPEELERALFADLKDEHVLRAAPTLDAKSLVDAWELGQAQAVLLAAVRITCEVRAVSPGLLRALFAKLKFHRLLFTAERIEGEDAAYRIVIDGPYSMFDSVTKYGVRLALALPAIRALERWSLAADIRWGKLREPLVFRLASAERDDAEGRGDDDVHLADEVRTLLDAIENKPGGWRARPASAILDVPGLGVCVPDLELVHKDGKEPVYVEVLGFWSRDAVFRRVELARAGLGVKIVFIASSRLRVSPELLSATGTGGDNEADVPASLYVYKGKPSPKALLDRAAELLCLKGSSTSKQ